MVSRDTVITLFSILTAVSLWDTYSGVSDRIVLQLAILLGIGVVVPTLLRMRHRPD